MLGFRLSSGIDAARGAGIARKPSVAVFASAVALASLAAPAFGAAERDGQLAAAAKIAGDGSVVAQSIRHPMTNVSFQSNDLFGREGGTKVYARLSKPEGQGPNPAVVFLHTCGGFGPHVYRDWADFLTGLGYVVLSVDSYGARGARNCNELKRVWGGWRYDARNKVTVNDAYGALDYPAKLPFVDGARVAVMGFSAGANAINSNLLPRRVRSSGELDFKAAIGLYGRCHDLFDYSQDRIPAMQIVGDKDVMHAPKCRQVGQRTPMEVHILPGVYHAFDSGAGRGLRAAFGSEMLYDAGAVKKARELVTAFLAKHGVVPAKPSAGD